MEVKNFELDSHYIAYAKAWWRGRTGTQIPLDCLSEYGFVCVDDLDPVAVMFFFPVMGSKIAMVGYPIANPNSDKRREALIMIVAEIEKYAKKMGYKWLVSYPGNEAAQSLFRSFEYVPGDSCINYIKRL
jgi:hypothetical protein